ncbi:hypothetical protein CBD41_04405 [bacterium TMED181]|nr:hypothetical protein [Planctomycetota bacterium]OUW45123.1 MAG: hypothetical protein CBD41_04405 [bacterium TMED181]
MNKVGEIIKKLREESGVTAKDLASQIGLSASQMSRLESGQRRINSEVLTRIAKALGVAPSRLIDDSAGVEIRSLAQSAAAPFRSSIGKVIRSARRQKHLTVEDLARKAGVSRAYAISVEEGRRSGLESDFIRKVCRILGLAPLDLITLAEEKLDSKELNSVTERTSTAEPSGDIPLIHNEENPYPVEIDSRNIPEGIIEDWIKIPEVDSSTCFALRVSGDAMSGTGSPVFNNGDIVVFSTTLKISNGDFAFVKLSQKHPAVLDAPEIRTLFCQYFHDSSSHIRLQFLRSELPPLILPTDHVEGTWVMTHHLSSFRPQ